MENSNNLLVVSFSCNSPCMESFKKNKVFTLDKTSKTLLSLFINEANNALLQIPNRFYDHKPLDFSKEEFGASQLMECHFTEFLIKLIRSNFIDEDDIQHEENRENNEENSAELISEYLKGNIYNCITLNDLCEHFFLRKSQLTVIFKNFSGKSPMQYYAALKISEAKKLLREDKLSVSEISDKLNFSCIHSFSRAFKKSTGFSPSDYRKSISAFQSNNETISNL